MIKGSENKKTGIVPVKILLLYSFFFYAAWSVVHFFIEPFIDRYENDVLSAVVIEGICKNLIEHGYELTVYDVSRSAMERFEGKARLAKDEAEKYFEALKNQDLKLDDLDAVTGGVCAGEVCGMNC